MRAYNPLQWCTIHTPWCIYILSRYLKFDNREIQTLYVSSSFANRIFSFVKFRFFYYKR